MKVAVVKEGAPGERRVALAPEAVGKLNGAGVDVLVETGAGRGRLVPGQRLRPGRRDHLSRDDCWSARTSSSWSPSPARPGPASAAARR